KARAPRRSMATHKASGRIRQRRAPDRACARSGWRPNPVTRAWIARAMPPRSSWKQADLQPLRAPLGLASRLVSGQTTRRSAAGSSGTSVAGAWPAVCSVRGPMRFLAALVCVLAVSAPVLDHAPAIAAPRSARSRAAGAEQPAPGSSANELRLRGAKGTRARAADPVTDILQLGGRAPSAPLTTRSNPLDLLPPSWSRSPKVAILGSSAAEATIPPALTQKLRVLGTDIARRGSVLVNGACPGVPEVAARAARAAGGLTIGIAPASSLEEHVQRPKAPTESISILHFAGTGGGGGLIEREGAIRGYSGILVFRNGRSGAFGEPTAGMSEPKVIALLEGSGGVAGGAQEHILPHIGQGDAVVVSDRDPRRLLEKAMRALAAQRSQAALTPTPSVSRPSAASAALPRTSSRTLVDRERSSRHEVFAFLGHETGMNREDRARVDQLSDLIARGHPGGRAPLVVVPTRSGLTSDVAQRIRSRGVTTIGISPAATLDQHLNAAYPVEGLDEIQLT